MGVGIPAAVAPVAITRRALMRRGFVTFCLAAWAAGAAHAAVPVDTVRVDAARLTMGAVLAMTVFATDSLAAQHALDAAFAEVDRLDSLLTDWRPTGDVARLNAAPAGTWVPLASETREVLDAALQWSRLSGGAFDPTIRPLVVVWGFRGGQPSRAPTPAELRAARTKVGAAFVERDTLRGAVRFTRPGMQLDLGGIAKGYALDRAGAVLDAHGVHRALLDFAGQVLALDPPPQAQGWPVVIDDARAAQATPLAFLSLTRASIATSSQSERAVRRGGRRIGHILDPRSGQPVNRTLACSALARRGIDADAMATAGFVVGPRAARPLAPRAGCDVLALTPRGGVYATGAFVRALRPHNEERSGRP